MPDTPGGGEGNRRRRRPPATAPLTEATQPVPVPPTRRARAPRPVPPPDPMWQEMQAVGPSGLDGVPAAYDDGTAWLRTGARRHPAGVWIALIAGWTGVWISLWGALLGAFVGVLIAVGAITNHSVSNALFHLGIGQAVTVLGVLAGFVLGAVGGFLAVLRELFVYQRVQVAISLMAGALISAITVVLIAAFERLGLRLRGYRRLSRDEVRRIAPLVKSVADAMELPALPRFAMADMLLPNAWTHMRTIVLTTGLFEALSSDEELEAVLAHELHHWRSGDAVGLRVIWVAALPLALVFDFGMWLAGARPDMPPPETTGIGLPRGLVAIAGWIIAWPAWIITTLVLAPVVSSSQRRYEYEADAAAAAIGLAAPLASALRTIGAFEPGRTGWEKAMTASHPPIALRVEALQEPQPDDADYQEDELRGPTKAEIHRLLGFWRRT